MKNWEDEIIEKMLIVNSPELILLVYVFKIPNEFTQ